MSRIVQEIEDACGAGDRSRFAAPKSLICDQILVVHKGEHAPGESGTGWQ